MNKWEEVFKECWRGDPTVLVDHGLLWILFHNNYVLVVKPGFGSDSSFYRSRYSSWLKDMWNLVDVVDLKSQA